MPKRPKVWLHFLKVDAESAKCNICDKSIATKAGNTTNLMKHLTMHRINMKAESCTVFDCKKMEPEEPFTSSESNLPPSTSSGISEIVAGKKGRYYLFSEQNLK